MHISWERAKVGERTETRKKVRLAPVTMRVPFSMWHELHAWVHIHAYILFYTMINLSLQVSNFLILYIWHIPPLHKLSKFQKAKHIWFLYGNKQNGIRFPPLTNDSTSNYLYLNSLLKISLAPSNKVLYWILPSLPLYILVFWWNTPLYFIIYSNKSPII